MRRKEGIQKKELLSRINWIYCWRLFCFKHEHYNFLQLIHLIEFEMYIQKVIKIVQAWLCLVSWRRGYLKLQYFINYNSHLNFTMIFGQKIIFIFKNNFKRNNHCKFIHHKSYVKPFLSYLLCIVCREYFSTIFNVKSVHYTR